MAAADTMDVVVEDILRIAAESRNGMIIMKYMQKARLVANLVLCVVIDCNSMSLNRKEFLLTVIVNHEAVDAGKHVVTVLAQ